MNPASIPNIAIPRSRFIQEFTHSTSWIHGDLIPLDCFEVLPGDDYTVKKAAVEVIMSTPIAPIMGNIRMKVCAFFVPMRLVWDKTEEFFGANKTSAGPQTGTYKIPTRSIYSWGVEKDSLNHYLGRPVCARDTTKSGAGFGMYSVLKERCYYFIWSEWYRAQQLQNPFILQTGNVGNPGSYNGSLMETNHKCFKVCKQYDIFTAATTMPQYGAAVELPLGTYAPLVNTRVNDSTLLNDPQIYYPGTSSIDNGTNVQLYAGSGAAGPVGTPSYAAVLNTDGILADLSAATAAKINDIRYAFQLQKYLERSCYGSRFFEVLAIHYGVTSPDSRLQRPEYLGGKTAPISIRTVLSTAGYDAGTGQKVGQPGACSITAIDISGLFSKGFVEPGYVMILGSNQHERLYSQGLSREDTKTDRFEFYSPEFANLGDQEIKNKEIMLTGDASDEQTFGYQGHWDEYRYRKNLVSGLLDPNVTGSLDFWTLAEKFTTRPSLSASFIEEDRSCLTRCLVTGNAGPDYIGDVYIQYQATRELPLYNIPGLVDHFGAL